MTNGSVAVGLRRKSVLIVEDNVQVQRTLNAVVSGAGFDTVLVPSVFNDHTILAREEAISVIERRAFDAAFVDKRLVEGDENNRDGLAILRHISRKQEGTYLALLTAFGEYEDSVELDRDLGPGAVRMMMKDVRRREAPLGAAGKWLEDVRDALAEVARRPAREFARGTSSRMFSGRDSQGNWEGKATSLLNPDVKLLGLVNLLDEIAETCSPLYERQGDDGIQATGAPGVMAGLYWARGVGEAVVILLAKDQLPDEVPRHDTWPAGLEPGEVLYQVRRKNLVGAVYRCSGVGHADFIVPRS